MSQSLIIHFIFKLSDLFEHQFPKNSSPSTLQESVILTTKKKKKKPLKNVEKMYEFQTQNLAPQP